MKETQLKNTNSILPVSEELQMYFCELKKEDENSDKEIEDIINYLRKKEKNFIIIEEKIEEPKIIKTEKLEMLHLINTSLRKLLLIQILMILKQNQKK